MHSGINSPLMKQLIRLILVVTAGLLASNALAQWQWLDKDGRKVFSDRPPPASVPEKSILKRPGQLPLATSSNDAATAQLPASGVSAPVAAAPQSAASTPKISGLDKDLAEKKKKAEQAESDKRKAEEDRLRKTRAENCNRAKLAKSGLDSGVRLARINAQGEREILDDAARAAESKRIQAIIDADCK